MPLFQLSDQVTFPPPQLSRRDGLLALGGDLAVHRLILAYSMGIFPWYSPGEPILWWSPDPRLVLYPENLVVNRSLRKTLRRAPYRVTMDRAFAEVISSCATIRRAEEEGTWIVDEMQEAYTLLHKEGFAHSVEAWDGDELVGGLYGVSLGRAFFGESMFARKPDASKVCFVQLVRFLKEEGFRFIDCQMTTDHLLRFGAEEIPRRQFLHELDEALTEEDLIGSWSGVFHIR
ncbi:leucyl/phenylalanyl-tRNA--protein transferase [Desulfoluna sp.]|uniref:leucyl/phenylalanyl-tRNA--protein transferase n=1 Tax=Desulfoluna sp. TaxID=2045199 RepID=UPI00262AB370|nr:leucyl/phenylalanyl-tRNA--protein transferase [Desulfoluna sp.]